MTVKNAVMLLAVCASLNAGATQTPVADPRPSLWPGGTGGLEIPPPPPPRILPDIPAPVNRAWVPPADAEAGCIATGIELERFEAVLARVDGFEAGRYYPPEEVAQALHDVRFLRGFASLNPCGTELAGRLDRAEHRMEETLSESLDKDSFVLNGNLAIFERRFSDLERRLEAADEAGTSEERRREFAAEYAGYFQGNGGYLLQMYVALFRGAMTTAGDERPAGARWLDDGVNPAAATLARLAPRVARVEAALGLSDALPPPPARRAVGDVDPLFAAAQAGGAFDGPRLEVRPPSAVAAEEPALKPALPSSLGKVRTVPTPAAPEQKGEPARKRFFGPDWDFGLYPGTARADEEGDRLKAAVRHVLGLSETVGDPDGRARLLHRQTGATCAVVSQQQVLGQLGLLPPADARAVELALARQANAEGDAFRYGVARPDAGKLLVERGVPVRAHVEASDERLLAAAASGRMLIASVDPGLLWRDHQYEGSRHAVLVTGAEVDRSGNVVGVFINDSGTGEASRFVTRELFLTAFRKVHGFFLEVL